MNKFIAATAAAGVLLVAPGLVRAQCSAADFTVASFQVMSGDAAHPIMEMPGKLVNHCKEPAAAQLVIEAKAGDGKVVQKRKFWPAGTANIAPGDSVKFDAGRMFSYNPDMKTYSVAVVAVRSW
ncbi:MAG TPA: hypothetical protein VJ862_01650 [Rhodanobacteraceae bacterium]|nr:hypothetical protein [Rhodanobacteraceae bacterium]